MIIIHFFHFKIPVVNSEYSLKVHVSIQTNITVSQIKLILMSFSEHTIRFSIFGDAQLDAPYVSCQFDKDNLYSLIWEALNLSHVSIYFSIYFFLTIPESNRIPNTCTTADVEHVYLSLLLYVGRRLRYTHCVFPV